MPQLTWRDLRNICLVWAFLFAGWALTEVVVWTRM